MNTNLVAVTIPVYKKTPDETEKKSFEQCLKVLGTRPIIFFCAHKFDSSYYSTFCSTYGIKFIKRTFNSKYFKSKENYSKLCLTKKFYSAFADYEFILIYQLDAWIFCDQLDYWCQQDYDYIGAPFPEDINALSDKVNFAVVGNGGFSLRRVNAIINVFENLHYSLKNWSQIKEAYRERISTNPLWWIYCFIRYAGYRNTINYLVKKSWEDQFFFEVARLTFFIRMPDPTKALEFSFEYRPSEAFKQNGNKLPMGCHGWTWIEYDEFWKLYINN